MHRAHGLLLVVALAIGCGDDASDTSGGTSDGGSRDSGSEPAAKDAGGDGGGHTPLEVECGSATCSVHPMLAMQLEACCVDAQAATCGFAPRGGNGACNATPEADPRCESIDVQGVFTLPSCCTSQGRCGVTGAMLGMPGCIPLELLAQQAGMIDAGTSSMPIPEPRACDAADGGVEDAGL